MDEQADLLAIREALVEVLNSVTEEGEYAAQSWAPDILRLMEDRGYRFQPAALQSQEAGE